MLVLQHHIPVQEVLDNLNTIVRTFHGEVVTMRSQRYALFKLKGVKCVSCDNTGTTFKLCRHGKNGKFHLNLYTANGIMMTKDHIQPKSKGGKDTMDNYQPMCTTCNANKGNNY